MKLLKINIFHGFLERLSPREKFIFYIALSFVSLTLFDRMLITPVSLKLKSLNKEINEKELAIKKSLRILAQKDRINKEIKRYAQFLESVKTDRDITSVLKGIEDLANKTGVYILDMKPVGLKESGSFKKYMISLSCEAEMEQLIEFMYSIESSNQLLAIEKCQLVSKSKESSVVKGNFSIAKIIIP